MGNKVPPASSYSVSFRLQRTTVEDTYISVLVTADLMIPQPDGTGRLDVDKMVALAIEMSQQAGVVWQIQSQQIQPHPIQQAPPGITFPKH